VVQLAVLVSSKLELALWLLKLPMVAALAEILRKPKHVLVTLARFLARLDHGNLGDLVINLVALLTNSVFAMSSLNLCMAVLAALPLCRQEIAR
jgi:hypothetical protein